MWRRLNAFALGVKPDSPGFVMDAAAAEPILEKHPAYARVLKPYLTGLDLNRSPELKPNRYVIDFTGMEKEEAMAYPDLFARVEESVRPTCKWKNWWQFNRPAAALYDAARSLERMLATARVTKYLAFQFVPPDWVYSDKVVAIPRDDWRVFATLSSVIHFTWADPLGTNLGGTFNYQPTECAQTMPLPADIAGTIKSGRIDGSLAGAAQEMYGHRAAVMKSRSEGLTDLYNRFHDPDESGADIQKLRQLHAEMDNAVAAAYGWTDLDLGHGFHEIKQGIRYTISEPTRREVLARLLKLNHERYAEEVKQGLHEKKKQKASKKTAKSDDNLTLFKSQELG